MQIIRVFQQPVRELSTKKDIMESIIKSTNEKLQK